MMGEAAAVVDSAPALECRGCGALVTRSVLDLGEQPLANSYLDEPDLVAPEPVFPLQIFVCEHCFLVQIEALEVVSTTVGLRIFDVERLPTHGGSLRLFACRARGADHAEMERVQALREAEEQGGLGRLETYAAFSERVQVSCEALVQFVSGANREGRVVAAYGAAAKGNTLLNACGLTARQIVCVADRSPHKQGRFLPGSHVPVVSPGVIRDIKPDYLLILPWNLRREIMEDMAFVRDWGCKFVVAVPTLAILE